MIERYLESPAGALFALESGNGDPVVLLHGVTANAYVFEPMIRSLSARFRVVALDQRGHGRSARPADRSYDGAAYAADVAWVIEHLGGAPAVVVGHSLGARNAVIAGATYPDLVAAVVAVEFTPFIGEEIFDALDQRVKAGSRTFADAAELRHYLAGRYPLLPAEALERRARFGYAQLDSGALGPLADAQAMTATCAGLREDLLPYLSNLGVPALLVRGAQSAFVTAAAFEATLALRPDLESAVVSAADHYVPEERPDIVTGRVEKFLADLGRNRRSAAISEQRRADA